MLNSIPAAASRLPQIDVPADYADLLAYSDGPACGTVMVFGTRWIAESQFYVQRIDGVPVELNPDDWFCFGKTSEDPLLINRKTGAVHWFPDTGVIWWQSDRFERVSANLGEFLLDHVFGSGYPALSGVSDDEWCEVLRRLGRLSLWRAPVGSREREFQSKLRALRERRELVAMEKELASIEEVLAPVVTGRSLAAGEVPAWVSDAREFFWQDDTEPADVISDEVEPGELAVWTEGFLSARGFTPACYVATHLSIKPWVGCAQSPGWTRLLRTVLDDPLILSEDLGTVIDFHELEYFHAAFSAVSTDSFTWKRGYPF